METWLRHRWALNLALVALVGGLLLLAWWQPGQPPKPEPLTGLASADVDHVTLRQPGMPELELRREHGRWQMTKPLTARANARLIEQLLRLPSAPVLSKPVAGAAAGFGLKPPRAQVRLNGVTIDVGTLHPVKGQLYVRHAGRVVLVPATHAAAATHPWNRFVDHRLLGAAETLRSLQLPGFRLELRNGSWHRQPPDQALSGDRINGFVQEWQLATALAVERMNRKPAEGRIVLETGDAAGPKRLTLEIVSYRPEFVLRRRDEGLEYHFPEDVGRRLTVLGGE